MPIVSRNLHHYRVQKSGRAKVMEEHTDSLGRVHPHWYRTDKSEADVIVDMNARDWTQDLVNRDISEVIEWVEGGNDTSIFDYTGRDIDEDTAEEEVLKEFARRPGESGNDFRVARPPLRGFCHPQILDARVRAHRRSEPE